MFDSHNAFKPLTIVQKRWLSLLLVVVLLFGAWVEFRGAFLNYRRTDVGVYFRAGWAVRMGSDPYTVSDDRGWHYIYPPLFAILMAPLADPPAGFSRNGYIPYKASVGIWYGLTIFMGLAGIHILAKALEETSGDQAIREQPRFCQRWWALRILPFLILLPAIGRGQMRGQVDMFLALLFCMAAASVLRGKRFRAGLWLAVSACVKMIPVFLLLLPAWRRDWRMLAGSGLGLLLGLIVIPVTVMGPRQTISNYQSFYNEVIVAGLRGDTKGRVGPELTGITSTDSNSPMVVLHNILHPDRATRPETAASGVRFAHWLIVLLLTVATLYAAGWERSGGVFWGRVGPEPREVLFLGALLATMLIASPVFSPHYASMTLPLITVLVLILWDRYSYPNIPSRWKMLFWSLIVSHLITSINQGIFQYLRDFGLILLTTMLLWAASVFALRNMTGAARASSLNGKQS